MHTSARRIIVPVIAATAAGLIGGAAAPASAATPASTARAATPASTASAATPASTASAATPASTATTATPAARTVTVHIDGINRAGKVVAAHGATLIGTTGFPIMVTDSARLKPQTYLIGAQIPTFSGQQVTSETLVVRFVRITTGGTIKLNARSGRRLTVSLTGAAASQQAMTASACLSAEGGGVEQIADADGGPGTPVYVVPMKSGQVTFTYLDELRSASGADYDLLGTVHGRIPSRPTFTQNARRLARVDVVLKGGADPTADSDLAVQPGNNTLCGWGTDFGGQGFAPYSSVDYRTAGEWSTILQTTSAGYQQGDVLWEAGRYRPGRSYSDVFGAAVVGPSGDFPEIEGNIFDFNPTRLFADPNLSLSGGADASTTVVTLRLRGHLVHRQTVHANCPTCVQTTLHAAGWYQMSVRSKRWHSAGLLSPAVQLTWRFHVTPTAPAGEWVSFPVTETVFQPQGLNLDNQAPADGHTTVRVLVNRAGEQQSPAPKYPLRTVEVQMSVNGGQTWTTLKLTKHGGSWLASVPDPASGYVSLRSVVTDTHGDSSTQTINRAFAVTS